MKKDPNLKFIGILGWQSDGSPMAVGWQSDGRSQFETNSILM
jgi:hypothetical protein